MAGTWVVTTALVVIGVDAAIERVARDVTISRPAPMTRAEVDDVLRDRTGTTALPMNTIPPEGPGSTEGSGTPPMTTVRPSSTTGTSTGERERQGPDTTTPGTTTPGNARPTADDPDDRGRDPTDGRSSGTGAPSTTIDGSPGGSDGQGTTPRP